MSPSGCRGASTRPHNDLRACVPPVSGPVKETSLLKMEKARHPRTERQGCRTMLACERCRGQDVPGCRGEGAVPVHAQSSAMSSTPGVYTTRMAWGKMARIYLSAWLNISISAVDNSSPEGEGPGKGSKRTRPWLLPSRARVSSSPSSKPYGRGTSLLARGATLGWAE